MKTQSPYKTPVHLGIQQWEHDGLVALVGPLSRGEMRLDMNHATNPDYDCGTVCCIGGHLAVAHDPDLTYHQIWWYVEDAAALRSLFYPPDDLLFNDDKGEYDINYTQAAQAIVNFLVTGDPLWATLVSPR